jgi:hypothetical protein
MAFCFGVSNGKMVSVSLVARRAGFETLSAVLRSRFERLFTPSSARRQFSCRNAAGVQTRLESSVGSLIHLHIGCDYDSAYMFWTLVKRQSPGFAQARGLVAAPVLKAEIWRLVSILIDAVCWRD